MIYIEHNIQDFPEYHVTREGEVWSFKSNKFLTKQLDRYGYYHVPLSNKGCNKFATVHRLVSLAYIPNPDNKPQANHIDGNKLNNHVTNLEWCTNQENIDHSWNNDLRTVKISDELLHKICKLLQDGMSPSIVGNMFNIDNHYISDIQNKRYRTDISNQYDFSKCIFKDFHNEETIHAVCDRLKRKISIQDISKEFNITPSTITKIKNKKLHTDISQQYDLPDQSTSERIKERDVIIVNMYMEGIDNLDIASELHLPDEVVRAVLGKYITEG